MTDRYAVIGNPVAHSLSPRIHGRFADQTGQDLVYARLHAERFRDAAERFFDDGGRGLNVTLPFKLDAFEWVRGLGAAHEAAGEAEAVNTIAMTPQGLRGYNTDGVGLLRDLEGNLGIALAGRRVLVLGAGGAVRGVLGPLLRAGPACVAVANRTVARADALSGVFEGIDVAPLDGVGTDYDVVINGTSSGVQGDRPAIDAEVVEGAFCYDMFYVLHGETPFSRWSAACGAAGVAGGLGMLIEQAAEAFWIWRGVRPSTRGVGASLGDG